MVRAAGWMALLVLSLAQTVEAQRRPRAGPAAAGDDSTVRSELAAVLLQSGRYEEAAREYRVLVAREPDDFAVRLGFARALAWGERPREAERELRFLSTRRPYDREIEELLRSVRESLEPGSGEAAAWLAERPTHVPYRRSLARALVREGRARDAVRHYEQLLALDTSTALILEAAQVQVAAGEDERAVQLLRGALARAPADTAARHVLAGRLAKADQAAPALAQYDTLIASDPGPALLLERGQLHLERRDRIAAEADAKASIRAGPSVGAYVLLGDLQRSRGDLAGARVTYEQARTLHPNDRAIAAAAAQLSRELRPIPAFMPAGDYAAGWHLRSTSVSDNAGITYATVGARRDVELFRGVAASTDVEVRRLAENAAVLDAGIIGLSFGVGLSGELAYGPFLGRLRGRGGVVYHTDGSTLTGAVSATGWLGVWGVSLERAVGPAYPSLLTVASIRSPGIGGGPLTETITRAALGGPLGSADLAFSVERAELSDANRRSSVQAVLRYPLASGVAAIYAGSGVWYAERSPLYWDPLTQIAGAAGLELATRRPRGLSFASRVLAGPARTHEEIVEVLVVKKKRTERRIEQVGSSLQLTGGADLAYRSETREFGIAVTYGSGRAGEYRRFEANVYVGLLR